MNRPSQETLFAVEVAVSTIVYIVAAVAIWDGPRSPIDLGTATAVYLAALLITVLYNVFQQSRSMLDNVGILISPSFAKMVSPAEVYEGATKVVRSANERLLVIQRTPSTLFNPALPSEQRFLAALREQEAKARDQSGSFTMMYAFSVYDPKFQDEASKLNAVNRAALIKSLKDLWATGTGIHAHYHFFSLDAGHVVNQLVIADDRIAVWMNEAQSGNRIYLQVRHQKTADDLYQTYQSLADNFALQCPKCIADLAKSLGLP